jgi:hypothetical protein
MKTIHGFGAVLVLFAGLGLVGCADEGAPAETGGVATTAFGSMFGTSERLTNGDVEAKLYDAGGQAVATATWPADAPTGRWEVTGQVEGVLARGDALPSLEDANEQLYTIWLATPHVGADGTSSVPYTGCQDVASNLTCCSTTDGRGRTITCCCSNCGCACNGGSVPFCN